MTFVSQLLKGLFSGTDHPQPTVSRPFTNASSQSGQEAPMRKTYGTQGRHSLSQFLDEGVDLIEDSGTVSDSHIPLP